MAIRIGLIGASGRFGKEIAALAPILPIDRHTCRQNLPCDVLIDVSSPEALTENLSARLPIVIGTTGHKDLSLLAEEAKHLPIFYTPNFSFGITLLRRLAIQTAAVFPADIDLIETHHKQKRDCPSGTALLIAQSLPNVRLHSIRSGQIVGEHILHFNTPHERLTLTHQAHSRAPFAQGALAAARFLYKKPPGLYGMDNLLDELLSSSS